MRPHYHYRRHGIIFVVQIHDTCCFFFRICGDFDRNVGSAMQHNIYFTHTRAPRRAHRTNPDLAGSFFFYWSLIDANYHIMLHEMSASNKYLCFVCARFFRSFHLPTFALSESGSPPLGRIAASSGRWCFARPNPVGLSVALECEPAWACVIDLHTNILWFVD